MADEKKLLTVDDCLDAVASKLGNSAVEVRYKSGFRNIRCPKSDKRDSFKIQIKENNPDDCFYCFRCQTGGNVPSLFIHLMQNHQYINNGTEAARLMHEALNGEQAVKSRPVTPPPEPVKNAYSIADVADIKMRDATYSLSLSLLSLSDLHRSALRGRGLTDEEIDLLGYKSLPRDKEQHYKDVAGKGGVWEKIPGAYRDDNGKGTLNIWGTGIFIPFRNGVIDVCARHGINLPPGQIRSEKTLNPDRFLGQIQWMQTRTDNKKEDGNRYFAYSSNGKEEGTPASSWVHLRKGKDPEWWREVCITEGALKADIASCISGMTFLAVPGVGNIGDLPRALRDLKVKGLEKVYLCYDMDKDSNMSTVKGENKIKAMLDKLRVPYAVVEWPDELKGIDDWLASEFRGIKK